MLPQAVQEASRARGRLGPRARVARTAIAVATRRNYGQAEIERRQLEFVRIRAEEDIEQAQAVLKAVGE